jgi:peptidoglycan/LPS O-acetylase OafA/YrhL
VAARLEKNGLSKRLITIQALRGLGALAVLAAHIMFLEQNQAQGATLLPNIEPACQAAIDLFFVISGFVLVGAGHRASERRGAAVRLLGQRLARVYPVFWIYSGLLVIGYLVVPGWMPGWWQNYRGSLSAAFLLLPQKHATSLLGVEWTLIHEVYFYWVLAAICLAGAKHYHRLLGAWALCVFGWHLLRGLVPLNNPFVDLAFNRYTITFLLGCLAGWTYEKRPGAIGPRVFLCGVGLLAVASLLYCSGVMGTPYGWPRVLLYSVPCALIVSGAAVAEERLARWVPNWLCLLGDASYSIYLTHVPVCLIVCRLWPLTRAQGYLAHGLAILSMALAALAFGLLGYRLVEAPLMTLTHRRKVRPAAGAGRATRQLSIGTGSKGLAAHPVQIAWRR